MSFPSDNTSREPCENPSLQDLLEERDALRAEVTRQAALLEERYADVRLVSFVDGYLTLRGGPIPAIIASLAQMLGKGGDGPIANYTETRVHDAELGELVLTLQRSEGKTPHELRRAAEAQRDQLADAIAVAIDALAHGREAANVTASNLALAKKYSLET